MDRLSERWMYYCGLLAGIGVGVDDLKHIQDLIDAEEKGLLKRLQWLNQFINYLEEKLFYFYNTSMN